MPLHGWERLGEARAKAEAAGKQLRSKPLPQFTCSTTNPLFYHAIQSHVLCTADVNPYGTLLHPNELDLLPDDFDFYPDDLKPDANGTTPGRAASQKCRISQFHFLAELRPGKIYVVWFAACSLLKCYLIPAPC